VTPINKQSLLVEQLRACYSEFQHSAKLPKRLAVKASPPLLVVPHERWQFAKLKLLIVGQETLHWRYNPKDIGNIGNLDAPIETFREFLLAKNGVGAMCDLYRWYALGRVNPKMNSPFWRGFRAIDSAINGAEDTALWTNVFKMNVNGSVMRNCRAAEISHLQRVQQGILFKEINILNPDVVVFFSGPQYDSAIRREFPDMKISALSRRVPDSAVGIVRATGLPVRTIRTYHPEYLQRSRQLGLLSEISCWAAREA
jgi:hypothetical protein